MCIRNHFLGIHSCSSIDVHSKLHFLHNQDHNEGRNDPVFLEFWLYLGILEGDMLSVDLGNAALDSEGLVEDMDMVVDKMVVAQFEDMKAVAHE